MILEWSRQAEADLEEAVAYIARDNVSAAIAVEERVIDAVQGLERFPMKGRARATRNARELVVSATPFVVIYRVAGDRIEIMRVWHTSRDPLA